MNNYRRKYIIETINQLELLKDDIINIKSEEEDYFNNIPENLQYSLDAENSQNAICELENAECSIEDVISSLQNSIDVM